MPGPIDSPQSQGEQLAAARRRAPHRLDRRRADASPGSRHSRDRSRASTTRSRCACGTALGHGAATLDELCARSGLARGTVPERRSPASSCAEPSSARSPARYGGAEARRGTYFAVPPRHVYVHVPFCARRCVYCDFSIAVRRDVPVDEYVTAVGRELDDPVRRAPGRGPSSTLYFGGGTPSRLGADRRRAIARRRSRSASTSRRTPRSRSRPTPTTSPPTPRDAWRAAGVNRLSLGAQSFDDRRARAGCTERTTRRRSARAVDAARRARHRRPVARSDLRAARRARARSGTTDLERALALEPTHVSLYGLTIEPHTPLGRWQRARRACIEAPDERYERGVPAGARRARARPASSTTRCPTSRDPDGARAQLGVLARRALRRARSVGARVRWRRPAVERRGVRRVERARGAGARTRWRDARC